ncbi:hypothetical protein [Caulobacter sp. 602-1]|uniref:hypothetical protein n=1 Tax=Caulobacter sp. 602-1 TaxID=2492472 RepID=UPI000F63E815|nr:hypothetical protein [Caulobacter sp. 602-1]RRN64394.1 hypothetical protein EIK80_10085 [Caulobacter sp. 602-1]
MSRSSSQAPTSAENPYPIDILMERIPQLAPPVRFSREITIVYWTAIGAWVCGGVFVALARRAGALAEGLGWSGVILLYVGAALIGLPPRRVPGDPGQFHADSRLRALPVDSGRAR